MTKKYTAKKMTGQAPEAIYRALGARVEQIRGVLGLTQHELAAKLNWSRGSIANIETGRQRVLLHDIEVIAAALGTTAKNLIKGLFP